MRYRLNNQSDRQGTNPLTIAASSPTVHWASAPGFPTLALPDYAVIVAEPDTANEEVMYLTAYTAGATAGTVQRPVTQPAHTAVRWASSWTANDPAYSADDQPAQELSQSYEFRSAMTNALPSGWAWLNQGTSTYTEDNGTGLLFQPNGPITPPDNVSAIIQPITFSYPFTVLAKFGMGMGQGSYDNLGMIMRASGSGNLTAFALSTGSSFFQYQWIQWTDPTTFNASGGQTASPLPFFEYWKLVFNANNDWDFLASTDGFSWNMLVEAYDPSGFETGWDHLGFYTNAEGGGDCYLGAHWIRF